MSSGVAVAIVVAAVLLALLVVWARTRQPQSISSGIEEFRREMDALAPERETPGDEPRVLRRPGRRRQGSGSEPADE